MAVPPDSRPFESRTPSPSTEETIATALAAVSDALSRLRYGSIGVTVHDGRVVQLDVTERRRFT